MNDGYILILLVGVVSALFIIISKLASFGKHFAEDTRSICYEIDHAKDQQEYRKWRGELRCHYLCLIPFVTEKNVMRLYNRIWHRADRRKDKERKDSLTPLLMPSILGICLCLVCVCSMTWAWYTASIETSTQKMTAAYYEVTVKSITNLSGSPVDPVDGKYSLDEGTRYKVTLTASGTVDKCGGYCLIQNTADGQKTYTQTFEPGDSIDVWFTPTASGAYTFTGVWGSLPTGTENYLLHTDSATTPAINDSEPSDTAEPAHTEPLDQSSEPSDDTYTVQKGDTLSEIAVRLNTTDEKLAAYNNIDDPSKIKEGQVLNIPPQDYVIPAPSETEPPATEPVTDAPVVTEPSDTTSTPADSSLPTDPSPSKEQ